MKDTAPPPVPMVPRTALVLGLAGVLPFAWGAATLAIPALFDFGQTWFGPRFVGQYVQVFYGAVILAFMSGVLWGFAARADERLAKFGYGLSVLPALWTFFTVGGGADMATLSLIVGFIGLLGLDYVFFRYGLTPPWWMRLRQLLTLLVVGCLTLGLLL